MLDTLSILYNTRGMNDITPEERMIVWKEMAKTQDNGFTWEAFKRMLRSDTMCGSQIRSTAKTILKKIRKSS
jgi:hypothetical protein|tara:strand:+ start:248 stop:463 length:216 start_codon:yes stop_codon:yes gene_type:complete